jgi:hypothetical protein
LETEHDKAQITIPAARVEQEEASGRQPAHYEQPRLESADGSGFAWPEGKLQATQQETPIFLKAFVERGTAVTVARELLQEKEEKAQRHKQHSIDYYYRQREADPEGLREKERVKKANYRARKRQEAKAQEGQKSQDNRS